MKQFICIGTWMRNNKGDIISEQEYNRMPIEAKKHNYKEYTTPNLNKTSFPLVGIQTPNSTSINLEFVNTDDVEAVSDFDELLEKNYVADIDSLLEDEVDIKSSWLK